MSKYIDASKLKAEIERRKELLTPHKGQGVILCREIIKQFDSLLSFIYTISQPIMKDDIIDEIRSEIERRFSEYNHDSNHHVQAAECASILDFLSSLESEKPMNPEDAMKELDEKIALVKQRGTWDGVDVDKYMDEVRGREPEKPVHADLEEAADEYEKKHTYQRYDGGGHTPEYDATLAEAVIFGAEWQKEQMIKGAVKWLVDDDYDELTDKGRFILGSVGIGYNGYYIPYSDLLKLPNEDQQ